MSAIDTTDKRKTVSIAENGIPVTEEMIAEWCAAYDKGELPEGYEVAGIVGPNRGRPPLHGEKMEQVSIRLPHSQKAALEKEAAERNMTMSTYVRRLLSLARA